MGKVLRTKQSAGKTIDLEESMCFLNGIIYSIVVDGRVKEQSKDFGWILSRFNKY